MYLFIIETNDILHSQKYSCLHKYIFISLSLSLSLERSKLSTVLILQAAH